MLARANRPELQAFLSINLVPAATVEQAVQYLLREGADTQKSFNCVLEINESECGFSFCKENCGAISLRLVECMNKRSDSLRLSGMFFSLGALDGRTLDRVLFEGCHFQPTDTSASSFNSVEFNDCDFERLEIDAIDALKGCTFKQCRIDSLLLKPDDEQTFDPAVIRSWLLKAGAEDGGPEFATSEFAFPSDERLKLLEKFLRVFLRHTHVDESFIRLRIGKVHASQFFDEVMPALLAEGVLEEVLWKGQGVQHRFKLRVPMSNVNRALEQANGTFEGFLAGIATGGS